MEESRVTITAYPAPTDARAAKGALDDAGIASVIEDEIARSKVRVEHVDALRAGDVLTAECPALVEIDEADEPAVLPICLACGSGDVSRSPRARMFVLIAATALGIGFGTGHLDAAILAVLTAALVLLMAGRWRCNLCGATWD